MTANNNGQQHQLSLLVHIMDLRQQLANSQLVQQYNNIPQS